MSFSYGEITSRKNEKIIWASKLCDKKNRDRENVFSVEGIKLLKEALSCSLTVCKLFFTKKALSLYEDTLALCGCEESYLVSDEVYEKLSEESAPQGVFAVIRKPEPAKLFDKEIKEGSFIILDDIQNPQNLGAIFRCAYSLGADKIVMSKKCADVYSSKSLRSGMGSIFKSRFYCLDNLSDFIKSLKECGNKVYCTHLHSRSLTLGSFDFSPSDSIVIGNEGHGVSQEIVDICSDSVIIPMVKDAESLNAATACSVIIWEMNKRKLIP